MKRFLLVGKSFSTITDYLRERGYEYIVLKDRSQTKSPDKKLKRRVVCDFTSQASVIHAINSIKQPIDAVLTVYENYVLPTSWIAEHLGLPGMPPEAATACTDKFLMRQKFAAAPEKISPGYTLVDSEEDLHAFAAAHHFPLILKPANLAKSLLVTKSHSLDELLANYRKTSGQLGKIYQKYAPNRTPRLLVEEFLEGSIHSVEGFAQADGTPHILEHIVDYQTGYDIGFEDNFHYSRLLPSSLSPADKNALQRCAHLGMQALEITSSPAHIEIILTRDGPRIVEIGARNGGYRERMHRMANGLDILGATVKIALGKTPDLASTKNEPCAVLELFPKTPGIFKGITQEEELSRLPSCQYFAMKAKPGDFMGRAADGYKACAVIILHNPDAAQFDKDLAFVNQNVHILTTTR